MTKDEYARLRTFADKQAAGTAVSIEGPRFTEAVRWVARAASREEYRRVLMSVLVKVDHDRVRFVATDSYRCHVASVPATLLWADAEVPKPRILVQRANEWIRTPASTDVKAKGQGRRRLASHGLAELMVGDPVMLEVADRTETVALLWCKRETCPHHKDDHPKGGRCTYSNRGTACKCERWDPSTRREYRGWCRVDGLDVPAIVDEFPKMANIMPSAKPLTRVTFEGPRLAALVRDSFDKNRKDGGRVTPMILSLTSRVLRCGYSPASSGFVPAKIEGQRGQTIRLNPRFLIDILDGFAGEVTLELRGETKAAVFRHEARLGLLMGVRG